MDTPTNSKLLTKMVIATIVRNECKRDAYTTDIIRKDNTATTFKRYTGVDSQSFKKRRAPIFFEELQHISDNHCIIRSNLTISLFREKLKMYYLVDKIPSLSDLTESSVGELYRPDTAKTFILKTLPGLTKGIIVEDPELVNKRILYLKRIQQLRKTNNHIVYVRNKSCGFAKECKGDSQTDLFLSVSSQQGLLKAFFCRADDVTTAKWIQESILSIAGPCTILMEEEENNEVPTQSSPKADMSNWLTANGVFHDPKAHRGEMYELIQKTLVNGHKNVSLIDEMIIAQGHQVVRHPKCTDELDFFYKLLSDVYLKWNPKDPDASSNNKKLMGTRRKSYVFELLTSLNLGDWKELETNLIKNEEIMYRDDMRMEKLVDTLCMIAADGKIPDDVMDNLIDAAVLNNIASSIIVA